MFGNSKMHKCPICKRQISKQAAFCPSCGQPSKADKKGKASGGASLNDTLDGISNTLDTINAAADVVMASKFGRGYKKMCYVLVAVGAIGAVIAALVIKMSPYRLPEADYAPAMAQCSELLEQQAEFGFVWTDDGDIKDRFYLAWWKDGRDNEVVELQGHKLKFLDDAGAEQGMSYTCEYNIITHQAEGITIKRSSK